MNQDIYLWSPVIVASLLAPHTYQQEYRCKSDQIFDRIEDIKLKIKNPRVERQGKMLEARMNLEIIVLVEDSQGLSQIVSRQEIIKDRLPLREFDRPLEQEREIDYIIQVQDLNWDGEMRQNELIINYSLSYMLFAVREQVVKLHEGEEQKNQPVEQRNQPIEQENQAVKQENELRLIEQEINRVRNDNEMLSRKLYLYERDLLSLQRGIKKAENRNAVLNRELNGYQEMVEKLRDAITRKDLLICKYENPQNEVHEKILRLPTWGNEEFKLGQRIKRMFVSN